MKLLQAYIEDLCVFGTNLLQPGVIFAVTHRDSHTHAAADFLVRLSLYLGHLLSSDGGGVQFYGGNLLTKIPASKCRVCYRHVAIISITFINEYDCTGQRHKYLNFILDFTYISISNLQNIE